MFIPFISNRSDRKLYRRKGGGGGSSSGGGGRGGSGSIGGGKSSGGGSSSGGKSSGSGSSSGGKSPGSSGGKAAGGTARSSPISSSGSSKSATSYGSGGGRVTTVPASQPFAGRHTGGGTRAQVFGNSQYGSGYYGVTGRGVGGRNFPFGFWPLAWGGVAWASTSAYLHTTEYGSPDNTSRPGGIMMTAAFPSSSQNTTFRLVADNTTVTQLIKDLTANCSSSLSSPSSIVANTYNDSLAAPKPEQTIQYYRASSVSLTLDGYNNTGALEAEGTPDTPLPTDIDTTLLNCLNQTIGAAVPLIGGASLTWQAPPSMGLIALVYLIWSLSSFI